MRKEESLEDAVMDCGEFGGEKVELRGCRGVRCESKEGKKGGDERHA